MRDKPKVGQRLFSLNIGNMARNREQKLTEVEVTKIGRKYFTCKKDKTAHCETQYHIDTWYEKTGGYCASSCLYETAQIWEDEKEKNRICSLIYKTFEYGRKQRDISLSDLRKIEKIIEGKNHD